MHLFGRAGYRPILDAMKSFAVDGINKCSSDIEVKWLHPGGTSGAHTTCCEERPVLLQVPSPAPGALLARLTVPA